MVSLVGVVCGRSLGVVFRQSLTYIAYYSSMLANINSSLNSYLDHFKMRTSAINIHNSPSVSFLDDLCIQFYCCCVLFMYYNFLSFTSSTKCCVYISLCLCYRAILCNDLILCFVVGKNVLIVREGVRECWVWCM